jgi:hypothetical protein
MTALKLNKYAAIAIEATARAASGTDPAQAWNEAAKEAFPQSPSSQKKGCPRSTYLSLAGAGHLKSVAPGQYTSAVENRKHAEDALRFLREDESLVHRPLVLWEQVLGGKLTKAHNGQMNVVIGLWNARQFVGQAA